MTDMALPDDAKLARKTRDWPPIKLESAMHDEEPYHELLLRYVRICNKVLAANRDRFPYRQMWSAGERALSGKPVVLALYNNGLRAYAVVAMGENAITVENIEPAKMAAENRLLPTYPVQMDYVMDVVAKPDRYVADPSLINWDWLIH